MKTSELLYLLIAATVNWEVKWFFQIGNVTIITAQTVFVVFMVCVTCGICSLAHIELTLSQAGRYLICVQTRSHTTIQTTPHTGIYHKLFGVSKQIKT